MLFFFYGVNKYELWILSKSTLWFTYLIKKNKKKLLGTLRKKLLFYELPKKKMIFKNPIFFCKLIYFRHTSIIINII